MMDYSYGYGNSYDGYGKGGYGQDYGGSLCPSSPLVPVGPHAVSSHPLWFLLLSSVIISKFWQELHAVTAQQKHTLGRSLASLSQ